MKNKIFGIGLNKTGTTSFGKYFEMLGYKHYCKPTYDNIIKSKNKMGDIFKIADEFEVFEDWPWPLIFKELYYKYPKSKFVLTIRKNKNEWFDSLVRHSKKFPSTKQRLEIYGYYNPNECNKMAHLEIYEKHNTDIINFFQENDSNRLLVLSTHDSYKEKKIYNFINKFYNKDNYIKYPHINKSK